MKDLSKEIKVVKIGLVLLIIIALIWSSVYTVKTGEVGIVKTFNEVKSFTDPGLHFKIPFIQKVEKMEVRDYAWLFKENAVIGDNEKYPKNTSINVSTEDMQSINIDLVVQSNVVDPVLLYSKFNNHHYSTFIQPRVTEIVASTSSSYTIEEMITKRVDFANEIYKKVKEDFKTVGLNVSKVSVTSIEFTKDYKNIMEQKKIATENVAKVKKEQEAEQAKMEAEQKRLLTEAEGKVKIAEQNLRQKELEAKANEAESKSLTPQILKKKFLEKWNGILPKVSGATNSILHQEFLKDQ